MAPASLHVAAMPLQHAHAHATMAATTTTETVTVDADTEAYISIKQNPLSPNKLKYTCNACQFSPKDLQQLIGERTS